MLTLPALQPRINNPFYQECPSLLCPSRQGPGNLTGVVKNAQRKDTQAEKLAWGGVWTLMGPGTQLCVVYTCSTGKGLASTNGRSL